jgi:hypothetical protein
MSREQKRWQRPSQQKIVLFLEALGFHGSQFADSGDFFKPPGSATEDENADEHGSRVR